MDLADARAIVVLGLGRSGRAATLLAARRLAHASVTALDEGRVAPEVRAELAAAGATVLDGETAALPDAVDLVVRSPGVGGDSPVLRAARVAGVPVWSEVEFASRFLTNCMVGITGTNGKTTTTALTGRMLADAGVPVAVGGNIGHPLAALPFEVAPDTVVVAELSSFQMEDVSRFRPRVAVLLNLTEDHLDRHGGYAGYVRAKLRAFENQTGDDLALLNGEDPGVLAADVPGAGRRAWFAARADVADQAAGVSDDVVWVRVEAARRRLCRVGELTLKGEHNLQNALAAAAAAAAVGVPPDSIARTLRSFAPVAHRLQVAAVVRGVTWVNDSKATNVDSTLKALTAYHGPVHLILGGSGKDADFGPLTLAAEGAVQSVTCIGVEGPRIAAAFARRAREAPERAVPCEVLPDLESAVRGCAERAGRGDVVLLSPACASFDQYRSYEHRGEHFLQLVEELRTRT